jgi:quinol monooxygenase YgiN
MTLYGRLGTITAKPGQREALLGMLLGMSAVADGMPGCRLYLIGRSEDNSDDILVTEGWDSVEAHAASLRLPRVIETIGKARPLIASISGSGFTLLGGIGMPNKGHDANNRT